MGVLLHAEDMLLFEGGEQYCEGRFYGDKGQEVGFVEHNGFKYLFMSNIMNVYVPAMQKIENLKPLTDAWKKVGTPDRLHFY